MTAGTGAGLASCVVAMSESTGEWPEHEGSGGLATVDAPRAPAPAEEATVVAGDVPPAGPPGQPSWPTRVARRVVRRPVAWARRPWTTSRTVKFGVTAVSLIVTTVVMMNVVHLNPLNMNADLVFAENTPTGGDMGAHVWAPAFLRDHLLPHLQLSGWTMDWYAGLPMYRFYMVVPALAIVALDTILPYGVAFKLVAVAGLVTLPLCCWAFGRLARFRYPLPELFAFAGLCFALDESFSIYGGNLKSTMAGEFSFSIALSLMMLGFGLLAHSMRTGGRLRNWAAIVLALAIVCHGIVAIYAVVGALVIVLVHLDSLRRIVLGVSIGLSVVLLSAWWIGPFIGNHQYMTDMKYGARPDGVNDSFWDMFFPLAAPLDVLVTTLAVIGLIACVARRHLMGSALGVIGLVTVALVYATRDSLPVIGLLWNPRLLPFIYLVRYLLMMIGAVELVALAVNLWRDRSPRTSVGWVAGSATVGGVGLAVLVVLGFMFEVLPGATRVVEHDASKTVYAWGPFHKTETAIDAQGDGWSRYNFSGYEGRPLYPEYYDLVQTMAEIGRTRGCGRADWENNEANGQYGTTMALMLLPHWTDGCIASMEGLFFEASGTTPYHFLTTAAISKSSSNPVRELRYDNNDAAKAVPYLQSLGVRYVMVRTPEAQGSAADQPELTLIATSGPWQIYEVADADFVVPLDVQPVVVAPRPGDQRERNLELGTSWFQHRDEWAAMPADDGPAEWQRITVAVDESRSVPDPNRPAGDPDTRGKQVDIVVPEQAIDPVELPPVTVSDVEMNEQDLSFHVDEIGVPVLVKVSYFPNWTVHGAEGPYRIAPNLMVVVPTSNDVRLTFDRSSTDLFFYALTGLGILLLIASRIWGDRVLDALDHRRRRGGLAVAGAGATAAWASPWERAGDSVQRSWEPPDWDPPPSWVPSTPVGPVRDVDDDPASDVGTADDGEGPPLP